MFVFGLLIGLVAGVMVTVGLILWASSLNFGADYHKAYQYDPPANTGNTGVSPFSKLPRPEVERRGSLPTPRITNKTREESDLLLAQQANNQIRSMAEEVRQRESRLTALHLVGAAYDPERSQRELEIQMARLDSIPNRQEQEVEGLVQED